MNLNNTEYGSLNTVGAQPHFETHAGLFDHADVKKSY